MYACICIGMFVSGCMDVPDCMFTCICMLEVTICDTFLCTLRILNEPVPMNCTLFWQTSNVPFNLVSYFRCLVRLHCSIWAGNKHDYNRCCSRKHPGQLRITIRIHRPQNSCREYCRKENKPQYERLTQWGHDIDDPPILEAKMLFLSWRIGLIMLWFTNTKTLPMETQCHVLTMCLPITLLYQIAV